MAVSAPPKKKPATATEPTAKPSDKEIEKIINRGSSTVGTTKEPGPKVPDTIKNFNVKILSSKLAAIEEVRAERPRNPISPKLGVSLQAWMEEAIDEKIKRERKQYNLD